MDLKVIASAFKLDQQIGVFSWLGRAALGDATVVVSRAMLADVLVTGAVDAVIVGGDFRKESEDDSLFVSAEDDDGGFHWSHSSVMVKPCRCRFVSKSLAIRGSTIIEPPITCHSS